MRRSALHVPTLEERVRYGGLPPIAGGAGGPLLLSHTAAGSTDSVNHETVTSPAINTLGATVLVVATAITKTATGVALSDSQNNVWSPLSFFWDTANTCTAAIWANTTTPSTSASHTFSANSTSASFPSLCAAAFSGVGPSDQGKAAQGQATPLATGSFTPNYNGELILTVVATTNTSGNATVAGGFTITDQVAFIGGTHFGVALAYLVQGAAAAINPTWTAVSGTCYAAAGLSCQWAAPIPQGAPSRMPLGA